MQISIFSNKINWRATIIHNTIRATCAGILIAIFFLSQGQYQEALYALFGGVILAYWFVIFPMGMLFSKLSIIGVPFTGLLYLFYTFPIVFLGDPLYFLLGRIFKIVPIIISDFAPMNFQVINLVLKD